MAFLDLYSDTNLDDLTTRTLGDDIRVYDRSKLTIDSIPQDHRGPLEDTRAYSGEIHIDGRYVREIAYSSGSGTFPTTCPTSVSWGSGGTAGTGKIIRYNSGDGTSGVLTLTVQSGANPNGTITDGTWSATVDTDKVGYLPVMFLYNASSNHFLGSIDADGTLRITGEWYEVGVGDGTDNQSFTLPHNGLQTAVWVETGNGTGVFEKWFRIYSGANALADTDLLDSTADWGATYESGFVYRQVAFSNTITFGTSTAGGAPPNGARIRIPNVHICTESSAADGTEHLNNSGDAYSIDVPTRNTNCNVYFDKVNFSTADVSFAGVGDHSMTNCVVGHVMNNDTNIVGISKNQGPLYFDNCAFVPAYGSSATVIPDEPYGYGLSVVDNPGGIVFNNCLFTTGYNTTAFTVNTSTNIAFTGTTKFAFARQDENSVSAFSIGTTTEVHFDTLIVLSAARGGTMTNVTGMSIDNLIFGQPVSRGATEDSCTFLSFTNCTDVYINGGRFCDSAIKAFNGSFVALIDCTNVNMRNFGDADAKLDFGGRGNPIFNIGGSTYDSRFQRIYVTNTLISLAITANNACRGLVFDNVATDYDEEFDCQAARTRLRGIHSGVDGFEASNGVETDFTNVYGTVFYDHFFSDTEGAVGVFFNHPGQLHANDVTITSGNPVFNGLGEVLLRYVGEQVVWEWPWQILGHTGFQNLAPATYGTNTANLSYEYALDTGSGYGVWKTASAANLSAETISPTGFRIRYRITCTTANLTNKLSGFRVFTTTTIAAQKANKYPLDEIVLTLSGVVVGSDVVVLPAGGETPLLSVDATASPTVTYSYETAQAVDICIYKQGYIPFTIRNYSLLTTDATLPIAQVADRNFAA